MSWWFVKQYMCDEMHEFVMKYMKKRQCICQRCFVLKGVAEFNDNDERATDCAVDVLYTTNGSRHGICNKSDDPIEAIVLILYQ